jgi:drug/metabolite transporter (DMT)-like permease
MSLVPVLLIPIAAITMGERASATEIAGTVVAFAGVVVMAA